RNNIDNYRISYLAYRAGEYPRASSILETLETSDAFYQGSLITLGHIALETGDKQRARDAFLKATRLDLDPVLKVDALFNYAKILYELDSAEVAQEVLREYLAREHANSDPGGQK